MILALEGPDLCGKTTLWQALKDSGMHAKFVGKMPQPEQLKGAMPHVEVRQEALWRALYEPTTLYVCDRHVCVSAPVYAEMRGEQCLVDWKWWRPHISVVYPMLTLKELHRRYEERGDDMFPASSLERQLALYAKVLQVFDTTVLDGTRSTYELVYEVRRKFRC